jgi:hypothetical protein
MVTVVLFFCLFRIETAERKNASDGWIMLFSFLGANRLALTNKHDPF